MTNEVQGISELLLRAEALARGLGDVLNDLRGRIQVFVQPTAAPEPAVPPADSLVPPMALPAALERMKKVLDMREVPSPADLHDARKRRGMTQLELAVHLGLNGKCSNVLISKWEMRKQQIPESLWPAMMKFISEASGPRPAPLPAARVAPVQVAKVLAPPSPRFNEFEVCQCSHTRKQHRALEFACSDCRNKGCSYFRKSKR
jgi:DNA-binding transcriptional regulator YiaG